LANFNFHPHFDVNILETYEGWWPTLGDPQFTSFQQQENPLKVVACPKSDACIALWPEILNIVYRNGPKASFP
jgi:hypothetical protein